MSRELVERASHVFLMKVNDYTEYLILKKRYRVTGYRHIPVASKGGQRNITSVADPNIDILSEDVHDNDNWGFDGTIVKESAQRVCVKRKLRYLQNKCCT